MRISLLKLGPARPGCSGLVQSSLEHHEVNNFHLSAVLIVEQSWHGRGEREDHVREIIPCQNPDVCCGELLGSSLASDGKRWINKSAFKC